LSDQPVSKSFPEEKLPKDPWEQLRTKPGITIHSTARREP
jgi:hypothetical protein